MRISVIGFFSLLVCNTAFAAAPIAPSYGGMLSDPDQCVSAVSDAETQYRLPAKLLHTIAIVESGRTDPATGRTKPWPWSINARGVSLFFASKLEAIAAVQDLQSSGVRSIDVGCMQINLMYHPDAFASLDQAFDPRANATYGARFLDALFRQIGNWPQAAAAYHSQTPEIGQGYEQRVMALWPLAAKYPDAGLGKRGVGVGDAIDYSNYTPQFAAALKAMHADQAKLDSAHRTTPRDADIASYTPEFAAQLKQMRRDMGRLDASSGVVPPAARTRPNGYETAACQRGTACRPSRNIRRGLLTAQL